MRSYFMLVVLFISGLGFGQNSLQYEVIDKKMDGIPKSMESSTASIANHISQNFVAKEDQIRAVFYWTSSSISYDVIARDNPKQPFQSPQEKVAATLKSRKGVCMHYAEVFYAIANQLHIETVIISGYNRIQGEIASLSHVWCASKINGTWYLFDPTWGSGYVNNNKYIKKLNNKFFKAEPKSFIASHMPFDYLWQFSEYPITNQEFYDNKTEAADKSIKFDFNKEIERYQSLTVAQKAKESAERIEKNGVKNPLIEGRLSYEKYLINHEKNKVNYEKIQTIITNFKQAGELFKDFLNYRNRKFNPLVSDEELKSKMQIPYDLILKCEADLKEVDDVQKENLANFNTIKASVASAKKDFELQLNFVNEYLAKDKSEREKMFYKRIVKKG